MGTKISIIDWLRRYYNLPYTSDAFENVNNSLDFLCIWSIFEAKFLEHGYNSKKFSDQMIELAEKYTPTFKEFDDTFIFFKNRYFVNNHFTDNFRNLGLKSKSKERVVSILSSSLPIYKDKLEILFIVIYKFRCNLFHGSKDPLLWKDFDDVFYHINVFLMKFLDCFKI